MFDTLNQAYQYLAKGGPVMILIGACSIAAVAIVIERWMSLKEKNMLPKAFTKPYYQYLAEKNWDDLKKICSLYDLPLSRLSMYILNTQGQNYTMRKDGLEMRGRIEVEGLEKNLNLLGSIASVSPLLGLLGTVTGMIKTFAAIKIVGVGDPLELSAGISEALLNTAAGLLVAIPAFMLHRYFYKKVDIHTLKLEELSQSLLNTMENDEVSINKR